MKKFKPVRVRRRSRSSNGAGDHIPAFIPTVIVRDHRFRFTSGASTGTNLNITRGNLLNLLVTAISAVTTVRIFQAVRLKKVEIWTNPVALGSAPTSCRLEWQGENSPSTIIGDTSMGVKPAHIVTRPPPRASEMWWSVNGFLETDQLFALTFPANTVIDVVVGARLVDIDPSTAGPIPVGATIGQVYGTTLDGNGITGVLIPQSYLLLP